MGVICVRSGRMCAGGLFGGTDGDDGGYTLQCPLQAPPPASFLLTPPPQRAPLSSVDELQFKFGVRMGRLSFRREFD